MCPYYDNNYQISKYWYVYIWFKVIADANLLNSITYF